MWEDKGLVMLPSLLFDEPSQAELFGQRAKPSFSIFKNEPNTSLQKFSKLKRYFYHALHWDIFDKFLIFLINLVVENGP